MKRWFIWLPPLMALLVAWSTGVDRRRSSLESVHGGNSALCADCHKGSVQQTHVPIFLSESHGTAAHANRASCLGCHEEASCDECHQAEAPLWHTEAFMDPGRGLDERDYHAREATSRAGDCMECHAANRFVKCGDCHTTEEWR